MAAQARPAEITSRLSRHSDVTVAFAAVAVIGMMVVPLPDLLLDALLVINLTGALSILLSTLYMTAPLQFSSFP